MRTNLEEILAVKNSEERLEVNDLEERENKEAKKEGRNNVFFLRNKISILDRLCLTIENRKRLWLNSCFD